MFLREVASKPCPSPLARPRARFDKGVHKNRPQGRCGKEDTRFAYSSLVFSEGAQAYFLRARRYFTRASSAAFTPFKTSPSEAARYVEDRLAKWESKSTSCFTCRTAHRLR